MISIVYVTNRGPFPLVGEAPLFKHDLEAGTRQVHIFGKGRVAGEFMFVARGEGTAEDDGWLIGLVIDAGGHSTALEIIDARTIDAPPVAVMPLGRVQVTPLVATSISPPPPLVEKPRVTVASPPV